MLSWTTSRPPAGYLRADKRKVARVRERTPLALRDGVLTDFSNRIAAEALRLCGFKKSIVNSALVCHRTRNSPTQEQRHEQLRFAQLLIRHFRKPGNRSEK